MTLRTLCIYVSIIYMLFSIIYVLFNDKRNLNLITFTFVIRINVIGKSNNKNINNMF